MRDHLRTLAMLSDGAGARNLRGGRLLSSILRHSLDGRTAHSELVRSVAADASAPWYAILRRWMRRGVLEDVHSEFFVREVPPEEVREKEEDGGGGEIRDMTSGYFTWHRRYALVEGRVPSVSSGGLMDVMTSDLAREVMAVGRGINFIRYCLGDREWEVDGDEDEEDGASPSRYDFASLSDLKAGDDELTCVSTLHAAASASSARIHSRILDSLETDHHLTDHLRALRQFLLLGQGDFVSSLVVGLDAELGSAGRSAGGSVHDHVLAGVLEGAVRSTNARFMPHHVLSNLRARLAGGSGGGGGGDGYWMGPPSPAVGDDGDGRPLVPWDEGSDGRSAPDPWDRVSLEYRVPSPVDAVVHSGSMSSYGRIFRFLFRLRRVEWLLNDSWRKSTALNHAILRETRAGGADAPLVAAAAEHASFLLRRISTTRQAMLHFVSNLQSYLMFEVLERGWEALESSLGRARTLDDVIRAHDLYLDGIVEKALLGPPGGDGPAGEEDGGGGGGFATLERLLRRLLATALRFGKFQEHIFANSIRGLDRAARVRRRVEERADRGDWGRTTLDEEEGQVFRYLADPSLFDFVERTTRSFDGALGELLRTMGRAVDEVDLDAAEDNGDDEYDGIAGPASAAGRTHDALPFLLFRLDFSGYYQRMARENKRKKKKKAAATATS